MHRFRVALVVGSVLFTLVAVGGPAWAGGNPPGNNGTVKVDGSPFDEGLGNGSHVDCFFSVDFYGFDEGDINATATFELQPPSGSGVLLVDSAVIGGDPAGGGTDLDGTLIEDLSGPIDASGASAHQQGFHIRLTVEAQGSIGSMTKHKTFWVDNCGGGEGDPS